MDFDPPLEETFKTLSSLGTNVMMRAKEDPFVAVDECELPLIDLCHLMSPNYKEREACKREIVNAATNWGFFQVINHGISEEVLKSLNFEERKVFHQPFYKKAQTNLLGLSPNSYRWGNPRATSLEQLSWSEAFHISLSDIFGMNKQCKSLRETLEKFAKAALGLSKALSEILVHNLGSVNSTYFQASCSSSSSYLRMNRYPPCPHSSSKLMIFGIIPHTDSDFISIVHQDHVGGLQLFKEGKWITVKPNPYALVINVGDLFQALSNGMYKSIKHRVVASRAERFSAAYFYCPTSDAIVESLTEEPPIYRHFTFMEYQRQNQKDVKDTGDKVGLERFLL